MKKNAFINVFYSFFNGHYIYHCMFVTPTHKHTPPANPGSDPGIDSTTGSLNIDMSLVPNWRIIYRLSNSLWLMTAIV